jgi:hypothetical protein
LGQVPKGRDGGATFATRNLTDHRPRHPGQLSHRIQRKIFGFSGVNGLVALWLQMPLESV